MRAGRLNLILALAFAVSFLVMWASRRDVRQPNVEFFPEMAHSPRANAFAASAVFRDGKTQQAPPPGTIPRGLMPLHFAATPADAVRAGEELRNPLARGDAAALARGEQVFANFCTPCHGAGGRGDGLASQRGVPPPPSLVTGPSRDYPDGRLFHILTYGQNNMASYASQLSREDRWRVILYLRSRQAQAASTTPAGRP